MCCLFLYYSKNIHKRFWWPKPLLAVSIDKSDILGFARSDIFLSKKRYESLPAFVIFYSPVKLPQAIEQCEASYHCEAISLPLGEYN